MENNRFAKLLILIAILGALNWGLVGIFNWNVVDAIFGGGPPDHSAVSRLVYVIVGLCGLAALFYLPSLGGRRQQRRSLRETPRPTGRSQVGQV